MKEEMTRARGTLAELKKKYSQLDIEASGLVSLIRNHLNPFETDITRLKIAEAASAMRRLHEIRELMVPLRERINEIGEALEG